jgi:O-antigen ligase
VIVTRTSSAIGLRERLDRLSFRLLLTCVVLVPLPLGSAQLHWLLPWLLLLSGAVLLADTSRLGREHLPWLVGLAAVCIAFMTVAAVQNAAAFAWRSAPVWDWAQGRISGLEAPRLAVVADQPWVALAFPLAMVLAFLAAFLHGNAPGRARRLLGVLGISGACYAVFGILSLALFPEFLLWRPKVAYVGNVTATFVNRNTAATYFGVAAVCSMLLAVEAGFVKSKHRRYLRLRPSRRFLVQGGACFLCLLALLLTGSRAGTLFSLLGLVGAAALWFRNMGRRPALGPISLVLAAVLSAALLIVALPAVTSRLLREGLERYDDHPYAIVLRGILADPWLGAGLGSFSDAFPVLRDDSLSVAGIWDRAHSMPLELAFEGGIPLLLVTAAFYALCGWGLVAAIRRRRAPLFAIAGLCCGLIGLVHSSVDFSLQIPGFSVAYAALLGCCVGRTLVDLPVSRRHPERSSTALTAG